MYNVTNKFKEYIKKPSRGFKSKVIIRDKEYLDDVIIEMSQEETVNPGDDFTFGSVASASFEISLHDVDDIFQNAIVKPYLGLEIEGEVEYIPLGVFTVDDVKKQNKTVKLSCFDNMIKMEKAYFSDLKYPAKVQDIANEICNKAGLKLRSTLPNYSIRKIEGYSLRESIGFIASLCGGFARFNREGQLEITSYVNTDTIITPDNYITFETGDKEYKISKVTVTKGEQHLSKGNETEFGREIIFDNPVITDSILNDIYNKYKGFSYMPYELKWQGNCSLMTGDRVKIIDLKGKEYNTLIMQQKLNYKGGLSSEIKAVGKSEQSNKFDSKGSVTQKLERYSIEQASIRKALIEKANIIDLEAINGKIENLYAEDLTAINGEIKNLKSEKADITQLNAQGAKIEDLYATKATIIDLEANKGKITILESRAASIENLLAGNIGAENIKAGTITASSGIIADGAIGDAQISSLSATKLTAGVIDAAVITVKNLTADNIKAKSINGKVLEDGAIDNSKVADNANIAGSKLNINDVIVNINGATTQINGTKINVGDRTLDMELKTQKITVEENTKDIKEQKLQLNALDDALKIKIDKQDFNSFKSTTEGNISTINTNLSKATSDISMLQGQIKLKVGQSDIDNSINSIQVGGRNLIFNSGNFKALTGWEVTHGSISVIDDYLSWNCTEFSNWGAWLGNHSLKNRPFDVDEDYTISFEAKANKAQNIRIRICDRDGYNSVLNDSFDVTENWKKYIYSFKPKEVGNERIVNFITPKVDPYVLDIRNIKLEKGNKTTDWTPAPEDIDQAINTIDTKINSSNSSIDLLKNQISAKVETSEFQSFKADINNEITNSKSKLSTTEQSINIMQGQISQKVSKTDIEKEIIEVNEKNKNLIINSGYVKNTTYWSLLIGGGAVGSNSTWVQKSETFDYSGVGCRSTKLNNGWFVLYNDSLYKKNFKFKIGQKYNLFGKVWSLSNGVVTIQICDDNNTNVVIQKQYNLTPGYTDFMIPFIADKIGNENKVRFRIDSDYDTGIFVPFVKLNEYTEGENIWTPAPEDVTVDNTTKINSAETEIQQLSNQIRSKVDVNGVKSFVEQNPSSVKVGFNAITPNVNLSNSGTFEVINGALHVKNNNAEVVIDGKYNMHKIVVTGIIKMYCPWNQEDSMLKINHGLGYVPAYSIYYRKYGGKVIEPLPSLSLAYGASRSAFGFDMIIRSQADSEGIQIAVLRTKERADSQNESLELRYFIYKEVAF